MDFFCTKYWLPWAVNNYYYLQYKFGLSFSLQVKSIKYINFIIITKVFFSKSNDKKLHLCGKSIDRIHFITYMKYDSLTAVHIPVSVECTNPNLKSAQSAQLGLPAPKWNWICTFRRHSRAKLKSLLWFRCLRECLVGWNKKSAPKTPSINYVLPFKR